MCVQIFHMVNIDIDVEPVLVLPNSIHNLSDDF